MDLAIIDQTKNSVTQYHKDLVYMILNFAGTALELPDNTEMSVTFVNSDEIQRYNREYRGVDKPTDVISFALEEGDDTFDLSPEGDWADDIAKNIGDILVSVDIIATQADYLGHSYERELGFLVVHGFLHLNGYDHMLGDAEEKEMFDLQRKILDDYGLKR
ncbi:MAG: rRNA maturation RNase YbeY [Leuconostoc gelidum]|jgi:probable rRNA maturation factor|uniref:Endoribonuclease YbeY n=1 Tax=Leuconostoc gelidum subsp. gelidum TaxID=1607839 RepID=A0AB35G0E9_LEUGE|nr:rRNA maturation RNase YbeY [Leuconostoc gelidum]AFS40529.1 putative metalloprotease [Leuconostoc gelidum JB7]MBZ5963663.1 rRNA maturation RNase YbeY [Leuconostoc gelidum subsp. gelidum]MBZ5975494.1 rRNA maturation RNase YbeY [Leuconostoc gelidum subsp. gelidum]MBZ5976335.1 rRNA maturation RNase YbeY [Leuconostoc gelidum subsp. gelidum]MBZ5978430.1 rRNA maturation RNase YbeY [Leuconostoc gelidum subsp. gelidum]